MQALKWCPGANARTICSTAPILAIRARVKVPHMLSQLGIARSAINQFRQLIQHELRREEIRQIGEFLRAARLFQRRTAHAADAVRKPLSIRSQCSFKSNLVPPDRDIDVVEAAVVEEFLFGKQLEFGKRHLSTQPRRSAGRGGATERMTAKNKSMWPRVRPTKESLHSLMQLAQGGIAAHNNSSPDMRAGPAQHNSKQICVNLLI